MKAHGTVVKKPRFDLHWDGIGTWPLNLWFFDPVGPPLSRIIVVASWHHNCDWRAMVINGKTKTKGLRTPPPRWVSAQLLYVWVGAQRCCQNLRRPFLQAVRIDYSTNYIIQNNFSPNRCNIYIYIYMWVDLRKGPTSCKTLKFDGF